MRTPTTHNYIETVLILNLLMSISISTDATVKASFEANLAEWQSILAFKSQQYDNAVSVFQARETPSRPSSTMRDRNSLTSWTFTTIR